MRSMMILAFLQDGPVGGSSLLQQYGGMLITLGVILMAVLTVVVILRGIAKLYVKVPPEQALVVYGLGSVELITGGGKIVWPFVYDYYFMDLRVSQVELALENVPNKDKIQVTVEAVATYKIGNTPELLRKASENFGDSDDSASLARKEQKVQHILESHLRSAISNLGLESLLSERDSFNQRIQNDSSSEMEELGLQIMSFNILHVSDNAGVIDALGAKETARILADANIERAQQTRRETIDTTTAQREGATTAAQNESQIAEAARDRDKKKLVYRAEVAREEAATEQAGPLAENEARKAVVAAEVAVERSRTEAEIELQTAVQKRNQARIEATTIVEAEGAKRQKLIVAEGEAAAKVRTAEGTKAALELEGEGQAKKALVTGSAEAEVTEKKGLAQAKVSRETGLANAEVARQQGLASAEVTEKQGLATAAGTKAALLATAEGEGALLIAQAEGRRKMVEAYGDLDEDQRKMLFITMVLDRLPSIITAAGDAGAKVMQPIAESITASVAEIGSITVYDSGGGGANGQSSIERVMGMGPQMMFNILSELKARGLLEVIMPMLEKVGLDLAQFSLDGSVEKPVSGTDSN